MNTQRRNPNRNPFIALILAVIMLIVTVVLYLRNGLGIDSIVFAVATLILLYAAISRFNRNKK